MFDGQKWLIVGGLFLFFMTIGMMPIGLCFLIILLVMAGLETVSMLNDWFNG